MFGHDKDEDKNDDNTALPLSTQPVNHGLLGIDDDDSSSSSSDSAVGEPSSPPVSPLNSPFGSGPSPIGGPVAPPAEDTPVPSTPVHEPTTPAAATGDTELLDIKREALQELSPLIDHLDQDSDEKFRTTMMMIQASDNKDLVPQAFKAAKEITDDKKRAQALLDIVNEINYFTHKTDN